MHERITAQLEFDYRTRRATAIRYSESSANQRAACSALNRERARGIIEAARHTAPGEQIPVDVWNAAFGRRCAEWGIPLIPLEALGITSDDEAGLCSTELEAMAPGAEASPFLDAEARVVYKLFDLRINGSLGKKFDLERDDDSDFPGVPEEERYRLVTRDATIFDTIRKLRLLNSAGAHPTEIVGLAEGGKFLIAKQPLAFEWKDLEGDTAEAIAAVRGVVARRSRLERPVIVLWIENEAVLMSDLHPRNIMRDKDGFPTIIDALLGVPSKAARDRLSWLREAIEDAEAKRKGLPVPVRGSLVEGSDDEL